MGRRVALYLRVSTTRQAEKDLSIPDQRRQTKAYCEAKGWVIVAEYEEPGASARDDRRPVFQHMVEDALAPDRPFDVILVHSFSRFFRDEVYQELYVRKLAGHGVQLQSATEEVGDGFAGEAARRILGIVAELENRQRAARVKQTMLENARQGFWNGGPAPFGYRTVTAEMRDVTAKKRLEIDPAEAEIVRLIYHLCLHGTGSGPMGVKAIVAYLNAKGFRYRRGRMFRVGDVHRILTSSTCMGLHYYNRYSARTKKLKDRSEWIEMEVPAIVEPDLYEATQNHLRSRRPSVTPARLVNGAMLLTKIAKCPHCGGGMALRTGKSGRYVYYACSTAATKGKVACKGRSISRDALDDTVLSALEDRLLEPEHVSGLLEELARRALDRSHQGMERERELSREQRKTEKSIRRMYDAVADGLVDDRDLFRRRLSELNQRRDELTRLIAYSRRRRDLPRNLLCRRNIETFSRALKAHLRGPNASLRRSYVRLLVDSVIVGEERIEIRGSKASLMSAVANHGTTETGKVPRFVREWRRQGYSDLTVSAFASDYATV